MPPTSDQSSRPSVQADYLNLTDATGQPLAGLLVLLGPAGEPVRAELHIARDLPKPDEDDAVQQTRAILRSRYAVAEDATVPLYVLQMDLGAVSEVQLPAARDGAKAALPPPAGAAPASAATLPATPPPTKRTDGFNRFLPFIAAALILLALLLLGWTIAQIAASGSSRSTSPAEFVTNDAGRVAADMTVAQAASAPVATSTPVPTPTPVHVLRDAYCMWPGDTLSEIAINAKVTVDEILAHNPDFVAQAGATLHLPPGSIPPHEWDAPMPEVSSIYDLPVGVSGYYIGYDNRSKQVALSFDMGYAEGNKELMEYLGDLGIRSTVFVLGGAVENHPEIIAEFLDNGHELGNHSYSHDNFLWMSQEQMQEELDLTEALTQAAYPGATTKPIFRAPFGAINGTVVNIANNAGYHVIGWTVDSADWTEQLNAGELYTWVTERVCPGAMIAFHDVNDSNGPALPQIIDYLYANGYEFVTVSDLIFP